MSKKRSATTELTQNNWDQEDEPEEIGTFVPNLENLKDRTFKKARRRLPSNTSNAGQEKSIFTNFTGFIKTGNSSSDVTNTFSFLKNVNGSPLQTSAPQPQETTSETVQASKESVFLTKLKQLNECLTEWVSKCVSKQPTCILSPIFRDYEKHLRALQAEKDSLIESNSDSTHGFKFNFVHNTSNKESVSNLTPGTSNSGVSIACKPDSGDSEKLMSEKGKEGNLDSFKFSFAGGTDSKSNTLNSFKFTPDSKTSFITPANGNVSVKNSVFTANESVLPSQASFASPKPFFFQNVSAENKQNDEDKDNEEPPKNEFTPVTEKDALFTARVKVFVQSKDGEKKYSERGIGHLYIKEVEDGAGGKTKQAIVRSDTSLGNVIFNIRLSSAIPMKRLGNNNICLVCIPTPESKPTPVPVLLKLKTTEEADELLEQLNKHKEK